MDVSVKKMDESAATLEFGMTRGAEPRENGCAGSADSAILGRVLFKGGIDRGSTECGARVASQTGHPDRG